MSIITYGKHLITNNAKLMTILSVTYNCIFGRNHFRFQGKNNKMGITHSFCKKTKIKVKGNGNKIIFGERCHLKDTSITIKGSNNIIELGDKVTIINGDLYIEDDNGTIYIGDRTAICGYTHLACIEGKKISIGTDCLFSSDVVFRVGDSHSILDLKGDRINPSQDISVGNHVWIGNRTILTKGSSIADNSIVGTGAIVTKKFTQSNVIIAGVTAGIIKENVNWDKNRL